MHGGIFHSRMNAIDPGDASPSWRWMPTARYPAARTVVVFGTGTSSLDHRDLARRARAMGASALLPKTANLQEMTSFVRACGLLGGDVVSDTCRVARCSARAQRM
jgi:hypothetical protein